MDNLNHNVVMSVLVLTTKELDCLSEIMRHIGGLMDFSEDKEDLYSLQDKIDLLKNRPRST